MSSSDFEPLRRNSNLEVRLVEKKRVQEEGGDVQAKSRVTPNGVPSSSLRA